MAYVATLISNPSAPALTYEAIHAALSVLPEAQDPVVLDEGVAVDIHFAPELAADAGALADAVRGALNGAPIDVVVQLETGRRKRLFLADMDSTMIGQECIDELADLVGLKAHVSAITERAMRGEIAFEPALLERVGLLKGLPLSALEHVYNNRITETPGGRMLTATMRKHGATCALVSGGFTFFTQRIADAVGFDFNRANTLIFVDEKLSGDVVRPILGRQAKIDALVELRAELKLPHDATLAIGDGANDLGMIEEAGLGVAYHAKPVVAEAADARIDFGDLSALLYLQGYKAHEIVKS